MAATPPQSPPSNTQTSNDTEKWGTHVMGQPAIPSTHPDNQKAALWKAGALTLGHFTGHLCPLHNKENEDISLKAKWRFNSCVRMLSDPMSLEKMARTWDDCARTVILERVQQNGGGTFSSKYGPWEDCLTAA